MYKIPRSFRFFLLIITQVYTTTFAHQDYAGDVHPFVISEQDTFIVQFYNNRENKKYMSKYLKDGTPIFERKNIKEYFSKKKTKGIKYVFDTSLNPVALCNNRWYQLVNCSESEMTEPPLLLEYDSASILDTIQISWGDFSNSDIHSFKVCENSIVGTMSRGLDTKGLHFFYVDIDGDKKAVYKKIGIPYKMLGMFPQASGICSYNNYFFIAWISEDNNFFLTAWNPKTDDIRYHRFEDIREWNTRPQIEIAGKHLIVTFHTVQNAGNAKGSIIRNVFIEIPFKR